MSSIKKIHLLIIDPQNDFCDPKGSLYVAGANGDMERTAALIARVGDRLEDIHVTLDSHHVFDIAHPLFWRSGADASNPSPFTIISYDDVKNGVWTTAVPSMYKWALEYTKELQDGNRYPLCIWPPHCLIGSWGHSIYPALFDELLKWETENIAMVTKVTKGSNYKTEHYSAVKAEVPDPSDPDTQINTALINVLQDQADVIAVAGEASSHCVANTMFDIVAAFGSPEYAKKIVLLTDCMSPVTGFEPYADDFFAKMAALGVTTSTSAEFLA